MTQVLTEITSQITDEFLRAVLRLDEVTDEACSVDWGRYALVCCQRRAGCSLVRPARA